MPLFTWIGKEKVVSHDKEVPFRLLKKNKSLSLGESSENLIVEGDNLEALKALLPFYYGKVKCIYIDPPYNTGNEKWVYNDRVNSPHIREWLGKVVGPEGEDLTRHDKWLCMMYPRLKLLHQLLRDDGVIFISIDDNEHCNLKMIMDDIFLPENFVTNLIWKSKSGGANDSRFFAVDHEFVMVYAKNAENLKLNIDTEATVTTVYNLEDEKGKYSLDRLDKQSLGYLPSLDFPIKGPDGKIYKVHHKDPKNKIARWRWGQETVNERYKELVFKDEFVYTKNYEKDGAIARSLLVEERFGRTRTGKTDLFDIFGKQVFQSPKPAALIKHLVNISTGKSDIVLDSFAGSGTTAQAVMELNKEDGGNRKFILVELEKKIAREITQERVRRVALNLKKVGQAKNQDLGFEYAELGVPLFNADGNINEDVSFEEMASYVYFTETLSHLDKKKIKGGFIGEHNGTEYYLLFKAKNENVLNRATLKGMKKDGEEKVVYADKCLLSEEILGEYNITFKQIPYQVRVY